MQATVRTSRSPEAPFPSRHLESCLPESSAGSEPSPSLVSCGPWADTGGNTKKGRATGPSPGDCACKKVGWYGAGRQEREVGLPRSGVHN